MRVHFLKTGVQLAELAVIRRTHRVPHSRGKHSAVKELSTAYLLEYLNVGPVRARETEVGDLVEVDDAADRLGLFTDLGHLGGDALEDDQVGTGRIIEPRCVDDLICLAEELDSVGFALSCGSRQC